MARPQCAVFIATSVDGFIARPDGGIDWLRRVEAKGEDYGFQRFLEGVDAVVMGRRTFEKVLGLGGAWPYADRRVFVLAHAPPPARHGETFLSGDPAAIVAELEARSVRRAYVDGGAVVSQLVAADRVDDLTISIVPVVLGDGIRLFQGPLPERGLALESARSYPSGLVQLRYRRAARAG